MAFFGKRTAMTAAREKQALNRKIHQLMQLAKYDRALLLLETQINGNNALTETELDAIYQYYGECLVQSHRLGQAIEVLSRGLCSISDQSKSRCRETLEELAIPAVEKQIIESPSVDDAFQLVQCLEVLAPECSVNRTTRVFYKRASDAYKIRDYQKAAETYDCILPFAEKHQCLDFEELIKAGDSYVKCNQLNKAWKTYETAKEYSKNYHQNCRLHKKIADLLVIRNQEWHAILHYLVALQSVPSDKGARTKLEKVLKKLGVEGHANAFLQLTSKTSDNKQLEILLMNLKKQLKAG